MGRAKGARGARGRRRKAAIVKTSCQDGDPLCDLAFRMWKSGRRSRCSPRTFRRRHVNGPNAFSTYSVGPSFHTADASVALGQPKLLVEGPRAFFRPLRTKCLIANNGARVTADLQREPSFPARRSMTQIARSRPSCVGGSRTGFAAGSPGRVSCLLVCTESRNLAGCGWIALGS